VPLNNNLDTRWFMFLILFRKVVNQKRQCTATTPHAHRCVHLELSQVNSLTVRKRSQKKQHKNYAAIMSQTPDPHASFLSDHEDNSSQRQTRHRRGRSRTPSTGSDDAYHTRRHVQKTKRGLPAVDEKPDTRAVANTPGDTADKLAETVAKNAADGGQDSTLSLRLDLNLDVYVKLTAKIHGDITLTLL
jgi:hypothetical protein